jgi:hypothetical protein
MWKVAFPCPDISHSSSSGERAFTTTTALTPHAFVHILVWPASDSKAGWNVATPLALVQATVRPVLLSNPLPNTAFQLPCINPLSNPHTNSPAPHIPTHNYHPPIHLPWQLQLPHSLHPQPRKKPCSNRINRPTLSLINMHTKFEHHRLTNRRLVFRQVKLGQIRVN